MSDKQFFSQAAQSWASAVPQEKRVQPKPEIIQGEGFIIIR